MSLYVSPGSNFLTSMTCWGGFLQTQNPLLVAGENTSTSIDSTKLPISTSKNADASMRVVGKPHPWLQNVDEYPFEENIVKLVVSGETARTDFS